MSKAQQEQSFTTATKGKFKIYVSTLRVDPLNKVKGCNLWEVEIPLMSWDIGVSRI